jgi:hypothetical protein
MRLDTVSGNGALFGLIFSHVPHPYNPSISKRRIKEGGGFVCIIICSRTG